MLNITSGMVKTMKRVRRQEVMNIMARLTVNWINDLLRFCEAGNDVTKIEGTTKIIPYANNAGRMVVVTCWRELVSVLSLLSNSPVFLWSKSLDDCSNM
jgi:hypothetical protein